MLVKDVGSTSGYVLLMNLLTYMPAYWNPLLQINLKQVVMERILVISSFYCLQRIIIIIIIIIIILR